MPKPSTSNVPSPASTGPGLRTSRPLQEVSSKMPLLDTGICRFTLEKFEPAPTVEGKPFNHMYNLRGKTAQEWDFKQPEGRIAPTGYTMTDSIWLGMSSKDGKDTSDMTNRKLRELLEAFYSEDEINEQAPDADIMQLIQARVGSEYAAEIGIQAASEYEGKQMPERNTIRKYLPRA